MSRLKTVRKQKATTTEHLRDRLTPLAADAKGAATTAAATAGTAAVTAAGAASHAASAARDWAAPRVDTAKDWAAPKVETAKDWAAPRVDTAKDWVTPKVDTAVGTVRDEVMPKVAGAVAAALAASEPVREEAMSRGTAAVAALRGDLAPPAARIGSTNPAVTSSSGSAVGRRLGQFLVLLGVLGGAFAGWRTWSAKQESKPEPWTPPTATPQSVRPVASTRTPYTPPVPTNPDNPTTLTHITTAGSVTTSGAVPGSATGVSSGAGNLDAPPTHDVAGASPDEAIADSAAAVEEGRKP